MFNIRLFHFHQPSQPTNSSFSSPREKKRAREIPQSNSNNHEKSAPLFKSIELTGKMIKNWKIRSQDELYLGLYRYFLPSPARCQCTRCSWLCVYNMFIHLGSVWCCCSGKSIQTNRQRRLLHTLGEPIDILGRRSNKIFPFLFY